MFEKEMNEHCCCHEDCGCEHEHEHESHECECEKEKGKKGKKYSQKEVDKLNEEISKWQEQFGKAMATAAHHENLSKYYKNEYEKSLKYRSQSVIESILPALDGFHFAFSVPAPTQEAENYKVGFEFVNKLLMSALESEGVSEILPKVGEKLDSSRHSAVEIVETEDETLVDTISKVMLKGYMLKDRIIRPANVAVYGLKKVEEVNEETQESVKEEN